MLKGDSEKNYEFEKTSTNIGATATISSNNTNSNIILNADKDINIMGADILAEKDNSNITLNAGNDINISTIQDYEYQRQYSKQKGGTFGTTTTREDIKQSLTNVKSNITANNNLSITTGNDLTSIGTNFTAGVTTSNHSPLEGESNEQGLDRSSFGGGSITFDIGNDLNLYNAMDYNYEYHYLKKEQFDFASAIANVGAAVAVGAMFPGVGAAVMAGISSGIGASQMTKGSIDITTNYDETTIANKLTSNNINIRTGNNLNSVSTIINDTTIDTVDTLMNLNNIHLDIGNGIGIAVAEERHEHEHIHDTWGGDIGRAALGGAITGLVTGVSMQAGKFAGKYLSGLVDNAVSGTLGTALTEATNASVNAATMSTMNTVGTAMSNTAIYGGNFKDVLKSGRDSLRDKDNLKSIVISGATAGITTGLSKYIDGKFDNVISKGNININPNATFMERFNSALLDSAISTSTNTALQSTINGDSFKETLRHQVVNSVVMAGAKIGANEIGKAYHTNGFSDNDFINKTTQLTLHAGLGAVSSKLTGGDYLSGAISGVSAEVITEIVGNSMYGTTNGNLLTQDQKDVLKNVGGLAGGLSAIVVSRANNGDMKKITNSAFAGQRVGQNAVENNLIMYVHGTFSNPTTFSKEFKESMRRLTGEEREYDFSWSGDNSKEARTEGATNLDNFIKNYEFAEDEPLIIINHSHGGNVTKEYSNMVGDDGIIGANGTKPSMTAVYNFATPNRSDYVMKDGVFDKYYNIYNVNDILTQDVGGGIDFWSLKNSSQTASESKAINIPITTIDNTFKYTDNDFNNLLKPNGTTFENYFNLIYDMSKGQVENHTEIKTPETVNTIYNYDASKYNEIQNSLKMYENFINLINNKR